MQEAGGCYPAEGDGSDSKGVNAASGWQSLHKRRLCESRGEGNTSLDSVGESDHAAVDVSPGSITAEQRARIEQNRKAALQRRRKIQALQTPTNDNLSPPHSAQLTAEQRARIEHNRLKALARRRENQSKDSRDTSAIIGTPAVEPALPSKASCSPLQSPPSPDTSSAIARYLELSPACSSTASDCSHPRSPSVDTSSSSSNTRSSSSSSDSSVCSDSDAFLEDSDEAGTSDSESCVSSSAAAEPVLQEEGKGQTLCKSEYEHKLQTDDVIDGYMVQSCASGGQSCIPPPRPPKERNAKQMLVGKLLCRWWYALPDWPPANYNYEIALRKHGFRSVRVEAFHLEAERDAEGLQKVFGLSQWPGLYRTEQGELIDVRPVEGRPSYDQLMLKSRVELQRLVTTAYENQLSALESQPKCGPDDDSLCQTLRAELRVIRHKAAFSDFFCRKSELGG